MIIVGIDEVGRGCWAGPLVAGAVVLSNNLEVRPIARNARRSLLRACDEGIQSIDPIDLPIILRDSKKLSKKQREVAAEWVHANALAVGLGWVWPAELDAHGITTGVKRAMERALEQIGVDYDEVIIDGNINYFVANPKARAIIKADDSVPSVSAASIVAKVARDNYMAELDEQYVGYGFAKHVGYGTAEHIAALQKLGVSDIHRRSYKPVRALLV